MYKEMMEKLLNSEDLTRQEMHALMEEIMSGNLTDVQIAGFLTALRMKGETKEEIVGCAEVMRQKASQVMVDDPNAIDTCGTGGDGKHTFNVSTLAAIVACGAGVTVVKHGNRSVSSKSGSADVLDALGVRIDLNAQGVTQCLKETNMAFLFAPKFHPSMKHVMTARRELGIRTIFNILGPLANPGKVKNQVMGVFDSRLTAVMAQVLKELGLERALVVHGMDGLDEISISAETTVSELRDGEIHTFTIQPEDFGMEKGTLEDVKGGDPKENAAIMMELLEGKGKDTPLMDMILLNSGAAIYVGGKAQSLADGVELAREVLENGKALKCLEALRTATHNLGFPQE